MRYFLIFFLSYFLLLKAQENTNIENLMSLSLEELLNVEITVASTKALTPRESPGIISIITKEDLRKTGVKDLIEALRLIPGFEFGVDVQGVVGVSLRGNWAHEGKVLLLIDGQEYNENLYSTIQLGNHFSVDQIERIEIIRGPGSAIYGGNAELGVVNIVTQNGSNLNGFYLSGLYSTGTDGFYKQNVNFSFGKSLENLDISLHGFLGKGMRSNKKYVNFDGTSYNMKNNSELNPLSLNIGIKYDNFSFRTILDQYSMTQRDQFGGLIFPDTQKAAPLHFDAYFFEGKYDFVFDKLKITPKVNYKIQRPWALSDAFIAETKIPDSIYFSSFFTYDFTTTRLTTNVSFMYDYNEDINIIFGLEKYWDKGISNNRNSLFNNKNPYNVEYNNISAFFQTLYKHSFANITVGARYDKHSHVSSSFVPRIALTKIIDNFHFKILYSNSFRAPGIKNIDIALSGEIKPEKTTVIEAELGYIFNSKYFITANIFDIRIKDPIIYFIQYDNFGNYIGEGYRNFRKTGTQGFEIQAVTKDTWGKFEINYSFYQVNENTVSDYVVNKNKKLFIGQPQHKVNILSSYNLLDNLSINPILTYISERYAYSATGQTSVDPVLLLNCTLTYLDIYNSGIDAIIGVKNILNANYEFIQPYNGGHANLPSSGTEYFISLGIKL